jgi:Zn-dependent protease with chaperone function
MILAALVTAFVLGAFVLVLVLAPSILLTSTRASEVPPDQAPLAHALLADLAPAAKTAPPRLFVIPAAQPNGFAVAGRGERIVALTEGAFEKLDARQLKGLLALLLASLTRRRARLETAIAALALVAAPFVLPSFALVRAGIRGDQWHEVDTAAATLVGPHAVADTLEKLEAEKTDGGGAVAGAAIAALLCVEPSARPWIRRLRARPSTEARLERLRRPASSDRGHQAG